MLLSVDAVDLVGGSFGVIAGHLVEVDGGDGFLPVFDLFN